MAKEHSLREVFSWLTPIGEEGSATAQDFTLFMF